MRVYKSITTVSWIRSNKDRNMTCAKHLWQGRFYDHVIRNETHLTFIRDYIGRTALTGGKESQKA